MIGWLVNSLFRPQRPYRRHPLNEADPSDFVSRPRHTKYVRNGERPVIIDDSGPLESDWEYVDQGIAEGWLVLDSWHREGGILVKYFRLKP